MKNLSYIFAILIFAGLFSTDAHAQFRNGTTFPANTRLNTAQNQAVELLLAPSLQDFTTSNATHAGQPTKNNLIRFSNTAKFFLRSGANLIRGNTENIPMYSFEEAWKYPGPTVQYPETATEYDLFLERYQRYTSNN